MKKILFLALAICALLTLSGCNVGIIDTTYSYDYALVELPGGKVEKVEVDMWYEYENSEMIQIQAKDGTIYYTHAENVVLVRED